MANTVPSAWEKRWEGPENPTAWIRIANKKGSALMKWVQGAQAKSLFKNGVNLSELFHPETFLNAFRQRNARIMKVAIDELKLTSSFGANTGEEGKLSLSGLWLQGSGFGNDGSLQEVSGMAAEIQALPSCIISWIPKSQADPYPEDKTVDTPVYHSLDREKLLCTFKIQNGGDRDKAIISGVALE